MDITEEKIKEIMANLFNDHIYQENSLNFLKNDLPIIQRIKNINGDSLFQCQYIPLTKLFPNLILNKDLNKYIIYHFIHPKRKNNFQRSATIPIIFL